MISPPTISTLPLEIIRMGVASVVLCLYGLLGADFLALYGPNGWINIAAAQRPSAAPWVQSLLFYIDTPAQMWAFYGVFVAATTALLVGWRTSWVKWLVLIGQISLVQRNPAIQYGVDNILSSLLLLLCFAPIGRDYSLDRARELRRLKTEQGLAAWHAAAHSQWASVIVLLIQLQMAVFFFYAGIEKLRGDTWWDGIALWRALVNHEYQNVPLQFFARHFWLINLLSYGTILLELAYPFLIWGRRTRPWMLGSAILLHLGIALFMGLYAFSAAMIVGHLAFVRAETWQGIGQWWRRHTASMEMIYDGQCLFCLRSMRWFLSFDFGQHLRVRDFRTHPSPIVSDSAMEKALHVVIGEQRAIPGFDAYRYVVLRIPGLWWMIPLFYIPLFSRLIGRPLYLWIARNRGTLATCKVDTNTK